MPPKRKPETLRPAGVSFPGQCLLLPACSNWNHLEYITFPSEDEDKTGVQQLNSETSSNSFWFLFSLALRTKDQNTTQSGKRGGGQGRVDVQQSELAIVAYGRICHTIAMTGGGDRIDSGDDHAGLNRLRALWSRSPRTTVTICTR